MSQKISLPALNLIIYFSPCVTKRGAGEKEGDNSSLQNLILRSTRVLTVRVGENREQYNDFNRETHNKDTILIIYRSNRSEPGIPPQ